MDRLEFIRAIFTFFRKDVTKNESLLTAYDTALSTKDPIDWDKLYNITLKESENLALPAPKWFISQFFRCRKNSGYNYYENEGKIVEVELKSGHTYEFELYNCSMTQNQIIDGLTKKYTGNDGTTNVVNIRFFTDRYEQLKARQNQFA